jgi:tetratricopeptide (TPR) repeat protein
MAPSNEPSASSSAAAVAAPLAALPLGRPVARGERFAEASASQSALLVFLVASLAFLLASFPARNSDVWLHLAHGRSLAHGDIALATGPAPATSSWLYDVLGYGLYLVAGGTGLVIAKAVLAAALAVALLLLSRTQFGWLIPVLCTALALLAVSARLALQPATVSCLLLAVAVWIEKRRGANATGAQVLLWPLVLLFVAWANLDGRFVLGLIVVALVEFGRALDQAFVRGNGRGFVAALGSVAVLAAACLINPAHVYAFAQASSLVGSADGAGPVTSPFGGVDLQSFGLSAPGVVYFALLALGLGSFFLHRSVWSWERFLPWIALAALSALQVRIVPFFAVVAGSVLAWNLQDFLASRLAAADGRPAFVLPCAAVRALRGLAIVLLVGLVACAWPGWLQGPPYEPRRWDIETAPSLERGAAAVRRWCEDGRLGADARALHVSRDTANAFAWFCPEAKGVLARTLVAGADTAPRDIDAALRLGEPEPKPGTPVDWPKRMRAAGVRHLVLYDADRDALLGALERLLADPRQWPLLYLEGDLAIFGWRDPGDPNAATAFQGLELDLDRLAFHPRLDQQAPPAGPERDPEPRFWWDAFWKPAPPRHIDRDEALLHLFHAESLRRVAHERHLVAWEYTQAAGLVAAAGSWSSPACGLFDGSLRLEQFQPLDPQEGTGPNSLPGPDWLAYQLERRFAARRDDTPPALLYLAIRAARRAVAVSPDDARAQLVLGESYLRLIHSTRERFWAERFPELPQLRWVQASIALNQAIALKPDFTQAHLSLAGLYDEMGYLDLALQHWRIYARLKHVEGPPPGVVAEQFREEEMSFQDSLDRLAKDVERRENSFLVASADANVANRAALAAQRGLGGKARDLLLASDVSDFGHRGMALELELLLRTGGFKEVREWTGPEQRAALGGPGFHWLRAMAFAGAGDYLQAQAECGALAQALAALGPNEEPTLFTEALSMRAGQAVLEGQPVPASLPGFFWSAAKFIDFQFRAAALGRSMRQEADLTVVRGLLALEQGDVELAHKTLSEALSVWKDESAAASGAGLEFNGRATAQTYLKWLDEQR